ncbi:hypothetical protein H1V43_39630 [Streptomyces sp. PSKA54]|uniref:Uncharacterized protein n=1 Tax=Streptomyces himalayensis subsp. aureolus TaxID=2758039 RepID=A0A7W2D9T5_9ACTN|nr:hypothetical protein [Streptomyces himalayensis]MBA4867281.1 hypothetical protein [Streptomyces himalayensis subsp. aureolus]
MDSLLWQWTDFPLETQRVKDAYDRTRATLVGDPLFIQDATDFGVTVEELDRRMGQPPARLDGGASWDWLDGPDQYRWAALQVLVDAYPPTDRYGLAGRVVVPGDSVRVVGADVRVYGDLVLEEQAVLFVLGGLKVTGALVGRPGYSMVAAREIECGDGATGGEVLALGGIRCPGTFYFGHNDHSARAASYDGGVLVDFERGNVFGRVDVRERVTDWDFAAAARVLGLPDDEGDLLGTYTAKLLGEGDEA